MTNQKNNFTLAPELKRDTIPLKSINGNPLSLCYLGLMNDQRFPWLIIVPQQPNLIEIIDLDEENRLKLMEEISLISREMKHILSPDKLNIAALGNMVSQLHIHIIARYKNDEAWPNPIWGQGQVNPYEKEEKIKMIERLE